MYCPNCGEQLPDNAGFCANCGVRLSENGSRQAVNEEPLKPVPEQASKKSKPSSGNGSKFPLKFVLSLVVIAIVVVLGLKFIAGGGSGKTPKGMKTVKYEELRIDVPKEYEVEEWDKSRTTIKCPEYQKHAASIAIETGGKAQKLSTREETERMLLNAFPNLEGIRNYKVSEKDGIPFISYDFTPTLGGEITCYDFFTQQATYHVFRDNGDGTYNSDFDLIINSIHFKNGTEGNRFERSPSENLTEFPGYGNSDYSTDEKPSVDDFRWYGDKQKIASIIEKGAKLEILSDLSGGWKCMRVHDISGTSEGSSVEMMNVLVRMGGGIANFKFQPHIIWREAGNHTENADEQPAKNYKGTMNADGSVVIMSKPPMTIKSFLEYEGKQYGMGKIKDGNADLGDVIFVRP